ncbi:L-lysine 2-3-aminomutase [Penicillium cf. griseofulvum]|uniref:L-lysine 2-3-aminomutase n=1 Tax=Penicillium cf. griseofulvum TaxID=2972120 RepID=A0A9W9MZ00_9EURO|nr:L-lysine 2-3-aminomutase [Penicillium cf. griseofulvum]KAJ5424701.1 L-lysine 2-3-aminomutase [Penicillium cf. griseofulvum]
MVEREIILQKRQIDQAHKQGRWVDIRVPNMYPTSVSGIQKNIALVAISCLSRRSPGRVTLILTLYRHLQRLPVRSAVLKPHAGELVVGWVTTSESSLLYVFVLVTTNLSRDMVRRLA